MSSENNDVEALEAELDQTREELGETVDELKARLDVKSRTTERLQQTLQRAAEKLTDARSRVASFATAARDGARERATDEYGKPTPALKAVAAGVVAAAVGGALVLWRRRR